MKKTKITAGNSAKMRTVITQSIPIFHMTLRITRKEIIALRNAHTAKKLSVQQNGLRTTARLIRLRSVNLEK